VDRKDYFQIFGGVLLGGLLAGATSVINGVISFDRETQKASKESLREAYASWFHAMNQGFRATKVFDNALLSGLSADLKSYDYWYMLRSNKPGTFAKYDHKQIKENLLQGQIASKKSIKQETIKVREALSLASSAYCRLMILERDPKKRKCIQDFYVKLDGTPIPEPPMNEPSIEGMVKRKAYLEESITKHRQLIDDYHVELFQFSESVANWKEL
jgi:hypothetical protein